MIVKDSFVAQQPIFYTRQNIINVPCSRSLAIRLSNGVHMQTLLRVYAPDGNLRAQIIRYKQGDSIWCIIGATPEDTSVNAMWGPIDAGKWKLESFVRPLVNDSCEEKMREYSVEVIPDPNIDILPGEVLEFGGQSFERSTVHTETWLSGDLHNHTTMSDGLMSPSEKMAFTHSCGLDFYAVTDHNIMPFSWVHSVSIPLRGMEVTTPNGHFNIIMPQTLPDFNPLRPDGGINTPKGINNMLEEVGQGGAFRILNHPCFKPWHCRWPDIRISCIDALEIICDPTYPGSDQASERCISIWDKLLCDGYRIRGVGGSDSHLGPDDRYDGSKLPSITGDPSNYVLARPCQYGILESLKRGKIMVSRIGRLEFWVIADDKKLLPGDCTLIHSETAEVMVSLHGIPLPGFDDEFGVKVVQNGMAVAGNRIRYGHICRIPVTITSQDGYSYIRIELRDSTDRLCAFSNPVFFGQKIPCIDIWGEVSDSVI